MYAQSKKRPEVLEGSTRKLTTGCGDVYVTVNTDPDGPFEVFIASGKAGVCSQTQCSSQAVLVSAFLRLGGDPRSVVKKLKGITCNQGKSCADAIAVAIEKVVEKEGGEEDARE